MRLRLGTRGSALARAQATLITGVLERRHPGLVVEPVFIRTTGDQLQRGPLAAVGGKGLFLKEIEEALQTGAIDCAVHSMKDVPAELAVGCVIAAVPERADPRDVLLARVRGGIGALAPGARIGTASVRRRALLLARRRDLDVQVVRGNVDTRVGKWRGGEFDAILLAAAGLARLGLAIPETDPLPVDDLLPAVGQGALALEARADDRATCALLAAIADPAATAAVAAERSFLVAIGGDCNTPLAAHATLDGDRLLLRALVSDVEGTRLLRDAETGARRDAESLGRTVAGRLLARGARELLGR